MQMDQLDASFKGFDATKELQNTAIHNISNMITDLRKERKKMDKGDDFYGKKSFHCGDYIPVQVKMDQIKEEMDQVISSLSKTYRDIHTYFWLQTKRDLDNFVQTCNEEIKRYTSGHNLYVTKKNQMGKNVDAFDTKNTIKTKETVTLTEYDKTSERAYQYWNEQKNIALRLSYEAQTKVIESQRVIG